MSVDAPESWTDQELVRRIRAQDEAALTYLLRQFDRIAERWWAKQTTPLPDSPRILAERARDAACQKAIQSIGGFNFKCKLSSWMSTIFIQEIRQQLRSFRGSALQAGEREGKPVWSVLVSLEHVLVERAPATVDGDPSVAVLVLRRCLERLTAEDQDAVRSTMLHEPDRELAAAVGLTPEAFRKRRERALRRFKDCFLPQMPAYG